KLGTLTPDELIYAYRAANCVIFPTRYESFGYVTVEGLACGVPVVTTDIGWTRELLARCPGYREFVVEPNLDSVTAGLRRVGDVDAETIIGRARAFIQQENSLPVFARRWLELIGEVSRA